MNKKYDNFFVGCELLETTFTQKSRNKEPSNTTTNNLKKVMSLVGADVYTKFIKSITEKQLGRDYKELPTFIIEHLPLYVTFDNNNFNENYKGMPIGKYTKNGRKMIKGTDILLNTNYFDFENQDMTFISKEYNDNFENGLETYYSVTSERNLNLHFKYKAFVEKENSIIFKVRLGE